MQQPAGVMGTQQAGFEPPRVQRRIMHHPAQDGVRAQRGEGLSGHVRGERVDAPVAHLDPLAVGTGQANPGSRRQRVQHTEDLRLLSAHHVRDAANVPARYTGRDPGVEPAAPAHPL
jgi:hypothetical protein